MNINSPGLINKSIEELTTDESKTVVDIYKMLVDMADRASQRRQAANNFYLSVNTAVIGASTYLGAIGQSTLTLVLIAVAGGVICLAWQWNIDSYRALNSAKFRVINDLEAALPIASFSTEWTYLTPHGSGRRYRPFHAVEVIVPRVFLGLHTVQGARGIPWADAAAKLGSWIIGHP